MTAAAILVFAAISVMILTEVLRSVIHARRKSKDGLGGTPDIAMWGSLICIGLMIAAAICGIVSLMT
ncbi:hypothetical protein SV7mr_19440 [Stieleria bergensis]|uniref:Uncharacterized protein n=1 Tax=Stieleria bergensis TaxID=2528025 RepID=A0A517STJ1_9BACT|nr:hypothetical protein SV7mr_19440 [Planctomycetes bacterium SV_7m_r]